jgi:hypothetical protein
MPVHPVLAAMLKGWLSDGWAEAINRDPCPNDPIIPIIDAGHPRHGEMRRKGDSYKCLQADLALLGFRRRRGHDFRRTMISLAQDDGASRETLRYVTHGRSKRDAIDEYTTLQWSTVCAEVAKLRLNLP